MSLSLANNIKIAWRNLWRNKRRTIITVSSIFFAVFIAILMRSFQLGSYNHMIDNMVSKYTGHLQIQDKDYMDNKSIDYSIPYTDSLKSILTNNKQVKFFFPRIQTGVLASSGNNSKVAIVMGVNYNKENKLIDLKKNIAKFYFDTAAVNYIATKMDKKDADLLLKYKNKAFAKTQNLIQNLSDNGIDTSKYLNLILSETKLPEVNFSKYGTGVLVAYKLAQYLELSVGDSIILMGQGFHGTSAVGKYKISGLLKFPAEGFNNRFIYMPLHTAQMLLNAYEINGTDTSFFVNYVAVNTIYQASIRPKDYQKILNVANAIKKQLNNKMLTVVAWHNLNKDIIQGIQMDNNSGKIIIFILYLIISFGVLGTVMMMIAERKREFGVMLALGMKRRKLSAIVSLEMLFMGLIAALLGLLVSAPLIWFGSLHPFKLTGDMAKSMQMYNMDPVLPLQSFGSYMFYQLGVVIIIVFVVLIYALLKIRKLKVIDSLRA